MAELILTLIGPDRPGLVRALSERVAAQGGNWLESRLVRLAGQFAGIVLVDVPDGAATALQTSLTELTAERLRVTMESAGTAAPAGRAVHVKLIAQDRPGIVRDVATVLAVHKANIEEMTTHVVSGPFSGETMFEATLRLKLPADTDTASLRGALERLGNEMMADIAVDAELQE